MAIIGQQKLVAYIDNCTLNNLPKAQLFSGPRGCGKHFLTRYLSSKLDIPLIEIDSTVTSEELQEYMFSTITTLYMIDLDSFSERNQHQFLKFIEEPSNTVYIVLLTSSINRVLPTVINRCVVHSFEPYTKDQLECILNKKINEQAFEVFKTPGKLLNLTDSDFSNLVAMAENIVNNIAVATYGNTLVISTKINYKDLYTKLDFDLFFDVVEHVAFKDYLTNGTPQSFIIFKVTNTFKQYATQQSLIKETLMLNYLTVLWEATR